MAKDQLHGWKEIATYLGRDERTAKRWEKQRGLPVRRIPGSGRANVYVRMPELEAWLLADPPSITVAKAALPELQERRGDEEDPGQTLELPRRAPVSSPFLYAARPAPSSPNRDSIRRKLVFVTLCLLLLGGTVGASLARHRFAARKEDSSATAGVALRHTPYRSTKGDIDQQYLQSLYLVEQRTPEALQEARRKLLEVTTRDPQHAPAFAQLAKTYLLLREFSSIPDEEAYGQAQHAAAQALALDPTLPEVHATLGYIHFFSARQPASAAADFDEALRLDPDCALAYFWYGSLLTHQGRFREALEHLDRAQQLQPTSAAIQTSRAYALGLSGHRDEAVRLLDSLVKAEPNAPAPHRVLARLSLLQPRTLEQYLDESQRFAALRQAPEERLLAAARLALHRGGEQAMWRSILASERAASRAAGSPTYVMAEAETQLGRNEQSLSDLEQLCAVHDSKMMNLGIDPLFDPLRQMARFRAIVREVGLGSSGEPMPLAPSS